MIDHTVIQLALRARLLTLSLATTGSATLSATAAGYARTAGSFVADGFWPGMELVASGFANNGTRVITQVTPTLVTVSTTAPFAPLTPETPAAGRTLSVGLPSNRAWENVTYTPIAGVPYIEEQYLPGPAAMETDSYAGLLELLPQYSPRVYVPADTGISGDGRYADAITRLFMPGTLMPLSSGDMLVVRGDVAVSRGQRFPGVSPGWSCIPVTIPLRVTTTAVPS